MALLLFLESLIGHFTHIISFSYHNSRLILLCRRGKWGSTVTLKKGYWLRIRSPDLTPKPPVFPLPWRAGKVQSRRPRPLTLAVLLAVGRAAVLTCRSTPFTQRGASGRGTAANDTLPPPTATSSTASTWPFIQQNREVECVHEDTTGCLRQNEKARHYPEHKKDICCLPQGPPIDQLDVTNPLLLLWAWGVSVARPASVSMSPLLSSDGMRAN